MSEPLWLTMVRPVRFSSRTRKILGEAAAEARNRGHDLIEPEHLLIGILAEGRNVANEVLISFDVEASAVRAAVTHIRLSRSYQKQEV